VMILPWLPGVANILLPAAAETTASVTTYILEPAYIALYTIIIILIGKGLIEASPRNYA